jgi:hypothetical protein
MTTNTAGTAARELPTQQVHYLRKTFTYADVGIASGIKFPNPLPAGAQILNTLVNVTTAFAGGTPVLTVGQNVNMNDFVTTSDVTETSAGATVVTTGAALAPMATDVDVYAKCTNVGTGTAGVAVIVISYVPNNDA